MTRHGGTSFGGGSAGFGFGGHGRTGGANFGPSSHHRHHEHHHVPPLPPPHRRAYWPYFPTSMYSPAVVYSPVPAVGTSGRQMPPPSSEVAVQYGRRQKLLNQSKAVFTFLWLALFIGTLWLYFGVYGSSVIQLGVHDSRLLSARPFWVKSIQVKNRYEMEGPVFYEFDSKPALNQESSWTDSQNVTWSRGSRELYYWLNEGSTVKLHYNMKMQDKVGSVYFAIIQDLDDLQEYRDRPDYGSSIRLRDEGEFRYKASADADYAFSLVTYNHKNVSVQFLMHFRTREYDTTAAVSRTPLKTNCKASFSFFRSGYGVLKGPGTDVWGVDTWEITVSYGIRWTSVILVYGLLTLVYLVTKSTIMASIHELDPALPPEYSPLVISENTQSTAPSAPVLPTSVPEEHSERTDKDISEDKLCSVCLDARKDSFFVPCGHCATCYECGLRISKSEMANCPICRQPITEVKRIYDA